MACINLPVSFGFHKFVKTWWLMGCRHVVLIIIL